MVKTKDVFDDRAAVYFLGGVFLLFAVGLTLWAVARLRRHRRQSSSTAFPTRHIACSCAPCLGKAATARRAGVAMGPNRLLTAAAVLAAAVMWGCAIAAFARAVTMQQQQPAVLWNPYDILELREGADEAAIKSAFRKLSLRWHPDRNLDNKAEAERHFVEISHAYEALTSEVVRRNWELYGNPDGPQPVKVGIALPSWLLEAKNSKWVLMFYLVLLVVLVPGIAIVLTRRWNRVAPNQVRMESMAMFHKLMAERINTRGVLELLSVAIEYQTLAKIKRIDELEVAKMLRLLPSMRKAVTRAKVPWAQKACILLYSHISRLHEQMAPEVRDDTTRIVNIAPNLCGGICLVSQARNLLSPMLEALSTCQMIVQACWDDQPLLQLPHFTPVMIEVCAKKRWGGAQTPLQFARLNRQLRTKLIDELELTEQQLVDIDAVEAVFCTALVLTAVAKVEDAEETITPGSICTLVCTASWEYDTRAEHAEALLEMPETASATSTRLRRKPQQRKPSEVVVVEEEEQPSSSADATADKAKKPEDETATAVTKEAKKTEDEQPALVHAPYLPEDRAETWWFILGDTLNNVARGVAKAKVPTTLHGEPIETRIMFLAPRQPGQYNWTLFAMSDSYIGRDLKLSVSFRVIDGETASKQPKASTSAAAAADVTAKEEEEDDTASWSSSGEELEDELSSDEDKKEPRDNGEEDD